VNKPLGVCLKFKVTGICLIILMMAAAMSTMSFTLAQTSAGQTTTPPSTTPQSVSMAGYGWISPLGKRDDFSFSARGGTLKADGWRYNPCAQASFTGRDFKTNQVIQVWSTKVWRCKVDSVEAGKRALIVGTATVKIEQQEVRGNWWFRITAKDATEGSKDTFMIQLWRPIGANNAGGWSAGAFKADKPGSLQLNADSFYQIQGVLKGGNIAIKP
jgi:hypothetical protein